MTKIYEDANDQHVRAQYIYEKESDTKAYVDADFTTQYTTSELKRVFEIGALIALADGSIVKPVSFSVSESIGSISYVVADSSVSVASLVSKADA